MKNGCVLCGGVGSGKSRTALAYYYIRNGGDADTERESFMNEELKDLYIITTARKRDTLEWENELTPFLLSTDPETCYYNCRVVVDSWNNIGKYVKVEDAFFIFDEQRVVGSGAWVRSFLKIVRHNEWILLSATPGDTWTDYVPVFLANGFYKNRTEFSREHVIYSRFTKYPKVERYVNTKKLERLRADILVDMDFRRNTVEHHETIRTDYDIEKYRQAGKTRWNPYKNAPMVNAAELCQVWRRIVNEDISRQVRVLELFEDHPKIIIFYNYNYELDILRNLGWGSADVAEWNGENHDPVPDSDCWVYLVQYSAGCEGWNCTKTDTMIFFSENYSYKVMTQAAGRINRLNTPYTHLYYYHLTSTAPIDVAVRRALANKKDFNERRFVKA